MSESMALETGMRWFYETRTNNKRAGRPDRMRIKEDAS